MRWADRPAEYRIAFARIAPASPDAYRRGLTLPARPVLALDVGGTNIRTAVVLENGERVARTQRDTPVEDGPAAIIQACIDALARSRDAAPAELRAVIVGVGVSSPGPVDPWRGVVVETPNMGPDYHDVPIAARIEEALGLQTFLERDTNVAALGEMAFGAARDCPDFIYLTVSTGVGGAIVSEGRLFHGPDGTAGELGHTPVDMYGPVCGCGAVGHLEALVSGTGIARAAREAATQGRSAYLAGLLARDGADAIDSADVAAGEDAGDAVCHELMERGRLAFSVACVGFVDALNPTRIVVGGAIADAQGDRLLGPAREAVARTAFRTPRARVSIVPAELGGDVGLAGAYPLVIARLGDPAWRIGRSTVSAARGD